MAIYNEMVTCVVDMLMSFDLMEVLEVNNENVETEKQEDETARKARRQKLGGFIYQFLKSEKIDFNNEIELDSALDNILSCMYWDDKEKCAVKSVVERIIGVHDLIEADKPRYMTMTKAGIYVDNESIKGNSLHKSRKSIDDFFESLGFKGTEYEWIFYDKNGYLELMLPQFPLDESMKQYYGEQWYAKKMQDPQTNLYEEWNSLKEDNKLEVRVILTVNRLRDLRDESRRMKKYPKKCRYYFVVSLYKNLFSMAKKSIDNRNEVDEIIVERVMKFYYDCLFSGKTKENTADRMEEVDRINEILFTLAFAAECKMKDSERYEGAIKHKNSNKLMRIRNEMYQRKLTEVECWQEDLLYKLDCFLNDEIKLIENIKK